MSGRDLMEYALVAKDQYEGPGDIKIEIDTEERDCPRFHEEVDCVWVQGWVRVTDKEFQESRRRFMKQVSKLTFEIITTDVWDDDGIQEVADEFAALYDGNLNISSACLVKADVIPEPEHPEEGNEGLPSIISDDDRCAAEAALGCGEGEIDDDQIEAALAQFADNPIVALKQSLAVGMEIFHASKGLDPVVLRKIESLKIAIAVRKVHGEE